MKKLFLAVCALSLTFFACKKDTAPVKSPDSGDGKKVALNIRTKDFLQRVEPLPGSNNKIAGTAEALRDSALAAKVSHLYYLLYDATNNLVSQMEQDADVSEDFGSFYDTAAPGNYTMVLIASQSPLSINSPGQLPGSFFSIPGAASGEVQNVPDIFYTKENVYVPDNYGSEPLELNMTLSRVVGNLQINILDMPQPGSGDTSVSIKITPEAPAFLFDFNIAHFGPNDTIKAKVSRISLNTFSAYVLNTVTPFTVTINYVDPVTGLPQTKVIDNISCYVNRRTILSGYLYGGSEPANNGIKIILLDDWNNNDNQIQF